MMNHTIGKLFGAVALLFLLASGGAAAHAGVAIDNAVMLDPYDPVPPIQFRHWYGSYPEGRRHERHWAAYHCRGDCERSADCDDRCGRHDDCDRDCSRDRCDRNCGHSEERCDRDCTPPPQPCLSNCYDAVRWEHRWRNGDRVGQEWYDSGRREREWPAGTHGRHRWYGHDQDSEWRDNEDPDAPHPAPK